MAAVIFAGAIIMTSCDGGNGVDDGGTDTPTVPNAPAIQQIDADNRELTVQWGTVSGATTYSLYWNTTGGVTTADNRVAGLLTYYYVHSGLSMFKTYSYRVTAVNSAGESAMSNEMSALAAGTPSELWKRVASDAAENDEFGCSVAISGDYVVVGVLLDDDGGISSGAAYIYKRNYGGQNYWGEVKKLTASDAEASEFFGKSVAIDGDYIVVGAYQESGVIQTGAAYVYSRNFGGPDNWGEVTKLTASNPDDFAYFGDSVYISGDLAVVGAFMEDSGGTYRGAAYVYNRNSGGVNTWGQVKRLTASDAVDHDQFGFSVSIDGDYAIVGARYKAGTWAQAGAAYIYGRDSGGANNWGEVTKLTASYAQTSDLFGTSVSISGDYVVVGALYEDGSGSDR